MIDYEADIFDGAARAAMSVCPDVVVSSVYGFFPATFPAVSISETDNKIDTTRSDMSNVENAAAISYDVRACSDLQLGAKNQAKKLISAVDAYMESINFTRTYMSQGEHPNNSSVYQITCRYTAAIGKDGKVYRRS